MNESLRRAVTAAGLGEVDVAARLGVDPKTVRRWFEGRLPFRRYRWELAAILGADDDELWPELRSRRGRPEEVVAVYPRCGDLPADVWMGLLRSASTRIGVLADGRNFRERQFGERGVLHQKADAGTQVRLCLAGAGGGAAGEGNVRPDGCGGDAFGWLAALAGHGFQVRWHHGEPYERMVVADEELLVVQRVWGVPAERSPVLRLQRRGGSGLFAQYAEAFEQAWAEARPL